MLWDYLFKLFGTANLSDPSMTDIIEHAQEPEPTSKLSFISLASPDREGNGGSSARLSDFDQQTGPPATKNEIISYEL